MLIFGQRYCFLGATQLVLQKVNVRQVVGIMKNNVDKVLERDSKLSELDERADALQDGASQFEKQAGKLKNKFWMQNMKFLIAGGIVGLILLILLYFKFSEDNHQYYGPPPGAPPPQQYAPPASSGSGAGGPGAAPSSE